MPRTMDKRNELTEVRTGETVMRKKWRTETRRKVMVKQKINNGQRYEHEKQWHGKRDAERSDSEGGKSYKQRHGRGLKKQWCGKKGQTETWTEETMMRKKGDRRRRGKNGWADRFVKKTADWLIQKEGLQYGLWRSGDINWSHWYLVIRARKRWKRRTDGHMDAVNTKMGFFDCQDERTDMRTDELMDVQNTQDGLFWLSERTSRQTRD